ncbi:MAG: CHC2 zinc finger domain-containing protein, partial [Desulfovibrionaceae bacterium]|nr:CHC2 zinc finger domain-containing protein [Desulfovibrionaceae bacterium]
MANSDAIALIKERIPIVDLINRFVPLRQIGNRFVAPCPFHQETKPSFNVTPDGRFYCFGCQKSGDIFSFWM